MKALDGLSSSLAGLVESPAKCEQCGATARLHQGTCVSCFLKDGLETEGEASLELFVNVLEEADVPDKQWHLGNYEILEEIGRGGMGVIYRARQRHSRRVVALKRVPTYYADSHEVLARFRREAEAAASLDHPNILPIYEVTETQEGLPFFTMKLAAGGSLRTAGPTLRTNPRECVRLLAKIARAIHYAHALGILHRDLQPGNILLDARGEPMVSDFGLAKWLDEESDLTRTLTTFGTPGYIAPESAEGASFSSAADIYSLGAILFNLLTGRPPFVGATALAVIRQAAAAPAPKLRLFAPTLGRDLETIVARCLERDPKARYQTASALADDLERWLDGRPIVAHPVSVPARLWRWSRRNPKLAAAAGGCILLGAAVVWLLREHITTSFSPKAHAVATTATSAFAEKSIAVLPFENLSDDKQNAYFADGMQDEILTDLARIADLKVISRASVMQYRDKAKRNVREIGKQLGVAHLLEGSVQRAGGKIRVNAQLIDARTDAHLWGQTYDRDVADVFAIQSDIANAIVVALQTKLTGEQKSKLERKPTSNIEAYEAYLRGLACSLRPGYSRSNNVEAIRHFREAVRLDPKFAEAWAWLGRQSALGYFNHIEEDRPALRQAAKDAADKAIELQPDLSEAYLAQGYSCYYGDGNYDSAIAWFEKAIQFAPNDSQTRQALAAVYRRKGDWQRSATYFREAVELNPRDGYLLSTQAENLFELRQYPAALKACDQILDIVPENSMALAQKIQIYQAQGNLAAAAALLPPLTQNMQFGLFLAQIDQLTYERRYGDAITALKAITARSAIDFAKWAGAFENRQGAGSSWEHARCELALASSQQFSGDAAAAKLTWQRVRNEAESLQQNDPPASSIAGLAFAYAALGDKAKAFTTAALLRAFKDAVGAAYFAQTMAGIAVQERDKNLALEQLAASAQHPAGVTYGDLKFNPRWDTLRGDPRFEKIVASLAPKEKIPRDDRVTAQIPEKSIAVLPFENLSEEKANAYFAEGIQNEILTRLSKIADLKVISRTSTQHYKSAPENLPQIARQLGVAHILEGTVQKSGDAVRVNVQLIKAATDSNLWADTFDRKLVDVFSVESDVAKAIADQLRAKLTGQEEQVIAAKPTDNVEAYDAYLRGLAYTLKTLDAPTNALGAQKYLREAVRLDPKFALSWALLSYVDSSSYLTQTLQPTDALREEARQAAETALALQPNLGEAVLAKGHYHYSCLKDYDAAVRYFEQARQLLANNSHIPESLAYVARRRGEWERSEAYFKEAERLDPRNVNLLAQRALSFIDLRRFPEALRKFDQVLNITPDDVDTLAEKAAIAQAEGDLPRAAALLAPLHPNADDTQALETQVYQAILERRRAPIISRLKEILAKPDPALGFYNGELRFWLAWAEEIAGDHAAARQSWRHARSELEPFLREQPENHFLIGDLALTDMCLGDKAAALTLAERAITVIPIENDALHGPMPIEILARVAAQTGQPDRAIAALQKLLSIPYTGALAENVPLTPALLRLDPMFDPLRNDPRFQKLAASSTPR